MREKRKPYVKPFISFEPILQEEGLCLVSVGGPNEGKGQWDDRPTQSKSFCLDDAFVSPIETESNEFEFTLSN